MNKRNIKSPEEFKRGILAIIPSDVKGVYVVPKSNAKLKKYSVHLSRKFIDYRYLQQNKICKILYDFKTNEIVINNQKMSFSYYYEFVMKMDSIAKDISKGKADVYHDKK